jgi:hypothetical protein
VSRDWLMSALPSVAVCPTRSDLDLMARPAQTDSYTHHLHCNMGGIVSAPRATRPTLDTRLSTPLALVLYKQRVPAATCPAANLDLSVLHVRAHSYQYSYFTNI